MTIIPLRAYNREIEGMIDNNQLDEAVAHCRHILSIYPKYIATYRLLGKVHLEQQRISDATDIFQRVLSSVPDDFIANVGMSIIREDENNLDAAIWHMELAYEAQPANVAIQDELRRLYGRRDGVQPPKVRLTRGALARMYSKGGLFDQATAELRSAVAEDPNRPDLQLLLAEMYYQTAQRIEAVEACANIIKKIPYCLLANRILAISLSEAEGSEAVKNYQQIVISLDPYYAFATPEAISSEQVPENAVNIERLDWKSGIQVEETPAQPNWATSLGISIEKTTDENLPEWLKSAEAPESSSTGEKSSSVSPFIWDTQEVEKIITDTSKTEDEIPDWMKDAGWQPATGEAKPPLEKEVSEEPSTGLSADENIEQGEIPDWLRGVAPESSAEDMPLPEQSIEADLSSPWLEQHQPGPTDSIIQWLDETKPETNVLPLSQDEDLSAALDEEIPDWLKDLEVPSPVSPEEGEPATSPEVTAPPTSAFLEEPSAPEEAKAPDAEGQPEAEQIEESIVPDIEATHTIEGTALPTVETSATDEILTSELETDSSLTLPEHEEKLQIEAADLGELESLEPGNFATESINEIPDWLRELAEEQSSSEHISTEPGEKLADALHLELEPEAQPPAIVEQSPPVDQELTTEEPSITFETIESHDLVDQEVHEAEIPTASEEPTQEAAFSFEEQPLPETALPMEGQAAPSIEPSMPDESESISWLDELGTGQTDLDEELTLVDEGAEIPPPEWVNLEPTPSSEEASAISAEEIPDWIKGLGEETEIEEAIAQPEAEVEQEQLEIEASPEQPMAETEREQLGTEAAPEQFMAEAEREQPELEAAAEQPMAEAEGEQLEMEGTPEQPMAEAEREQPEMEAAPEIPEIQASAEQPEEEIAITELAQEVTSGENIPPEEEMPAWLLELEAPEAEVDQTSPPEETQKIETGEMPAWLQEITETEPVVEATDAIAPTDAEITSTALEETTQQTEEILAASEVSEEEAPEAVSETPARIPEDEELIQYEAAEPLEAEVSISAPMEEQLPEETVPVEAEENQEVLAEARAYIDQGQALQAVKSYEGLIRQDFQLDEIIQDLTDAVYRFPVDPEMWITLGDAYFRKDQLQDALNAYNKAEELAK